MNFFKLYIGDYQRDTAHLTVTEHGAYLLMLQHYYATEKPLPEGKALHRMLRAQDKAEREAIDSIVAQFWTNTPAGLVNERADAEIAKASTQAEVNARIAREREAKRKAPRKPDDPPPGSSHDPRHDKPNDPSTNRATNDQPNHSQTPDTRHQDQYKNKARAMVADPPASAPALSPEPEAKPTAAGLACRAIKAAGIADVNPGHPLLQRLLEGGVTAADLVATAAELVAKGKPKFLLLLATQEGRLRDAAAAGPVPARAPAPPAVDQAAATQQLLAEQAEHARKAVPAPEAVRQRIAGLKRVLTS